MTSKDKIYMEICREKKSIKNLSHPMPSKQIQATREFKFPMLLIKGSPGAVISESRVKWFKERILHLVVRDIGPDIHYLQEDNPEGIGNWILEWSAKIA